MVVDEGGALLTTGAKLDNPANSMRDRRRLEGFGALAAVLMGAVTNGSDLLGGVSSVTVSYRNAKITIFKLVEYGLLLVAQTMRSTDSEYIVGQVSKLLATNTPECSS
jgi:hypothetical protein